MFDNREGIVKMMQQFFPFQEFLALPETHCMILQCCPAHDQQVLVVFFQALLQLVLQIPGHSLDYLLRLSKRFQECC